MTNTDSEKSDLSSDFQEEYKQNLKKNLDFTSSTFENFNVRIILKPSSSTIQSPFSVKNKFSETHVDISIIDNQILDCMNRYNFINKKELWDYLQKKTDLIPVLYKSYTQISKIIEKDFIRIDIEYNKDFDEDFEALLITVIINDINSVFNYLNKLEEEWLFKLEKNINKNLFIDVSIN